MKSETIVAVSTARGRAAVGIVRLSGSEVSSVVGSIFRPARAGAVDNEDRRHRLGEVMDETGIVLDQVLLLYMKGPHSYTGEDIAELHCHGNPWILERLVNAAIHFGARTAEPGEFTRRAFLNGKLDLLQADAVIQVINASSERALQAARRLLVGELSARLEDYTARLIDVLKWLEMAIDFPEEDIERASDAQLIVQLNALNMELQGLVDSFRRGHRARAGVRVVLCGRANVGKSSLFNRLLGYRRSIVADVPGTTRDLVEAPIEIGGVLVHLQDTAGLRETMDALEGVGMEITQEALGKADLAIVVVDGSSPRLSDDIAVVEAVRRTGVEWIGVVNKVDRVTERCWTPELEHGWIGLSAEFGTGVIELQERLTGLILGDLDSDGVLLTSRWQKEVLEGVLKNISGAIAAILTGLSPEATAFELYEALTLLDQVRGGPGREAVMDRVFAEFCLGK